MMKYVAVPPVAKKNGKTNSKNSNDHLPLEIKSVRNGTLAKRVSDDAQHSVFRRRKQKCKIYGVFIVFFLGFRGAMTIPTPPADSPQFFALDWPFMSFVRSKIIKMHAFPISFSRFFLATGGAGVQTNHCIVIVNSRLTSFVRVF